MKKTWNLLGLLLLVFSLSNAQEINHYKYVQVPLAFDDFKEENQYQINALTAFLLEKQGFEVFYEEEVPREIPVCEILRAKLRNHSGLFTTKVILNLEDCHGKSVFTTSEGSSREKEFQKAYHEAIREAFSSLEGEYAYSGKPKLLSPPAASQAAGERSAVQEEAAPKEAVAGIPQSAPEEARVQESRELTEVPSEARYRNGSTEYRLEKTASGYSLYRESESDAFAKLLKSGGGDNYIYTSQGLQGNAYFDSQNNLVVEYVDAHFGQLVSVKYLLQP